MTGHRHRVANYPGVTVESRTAFLRVPRGAMPMEVVDLPGAYSLNPRSSDEAIVIQTLIGETRDGRVPDVIISVVDATNLKRHLFLTSQLLELDRPLVVALNMMDLAERKGSRIDVQCLSRLLGVPVVPIVATARRGIDELILTVVEEIGRPIVSREPLFPKQVQAEVESLIEKFAFRMNGNRIGAGVIISHALLSPGGFHEDRLRQVVGQPLTAEFEDRRKRLSDGGVSLTEIEARARYAWLEHAANECSLGPLAVNLTRTERADRWLTHRVWGTLVLVVLMGTCFQAIYAWSAPVMGAIEGIVGEGGARLGSFLADGPLRSLLVDGIVAGVGSVLVFLPQILVLFLFIGIVEDCGYLARAVFLLDRWMRRIGLSGKAVLPLLSSFACAVPAILSTRVIEERRDRILTILIAPLMSCSARLPVYTLMIAAFVPRKSVLGGWVSLQAATLLAMYLVGVLAAIPVAWLVKKTILRGKAPPLLIELPNYKWPSISTVYFRVVEQGRSFCVSAGTMIFAVTVVIWALGYFPRSREIAAQYDARRTALTARFDEASAADSVRAVDLSVTVEGDERAKNDAWKTIQEELDGLDREEAGELLRRSFLGRAGAWIEPAVRPLGWDWRIGTAAVASFPAREVVIATMGTIYNLGGNTDENSASLRGAIAAATWPDGRPVFNLAVALSIMVFFALCCQCGATLAVIRRETRSWRWPVITFVYMTALAYVGALFTYQLAIRLI